MGIDYDKEYAAFFDKALTEFYGRNLLCWLYVNRPKAYGLVVKQYPNAKLTSGERLTCGLVK